MSLRRFTSLSLLVLASLGMVVACSSGDDDPAPPAGQPSSTTRISAKDGGKVTDASGKATLNIPAGALAEDTDISLTVSPATNATAAPIYDFGPDGLQFLIPATLEIKLDAAAIGDKNVAVALETGGKFVALPTSSYADGVASAKVEHFSKFTVVYLDGVPQDQACEESIRSFEACGGDLTGTWIFADFCLDMRSTDTNCPEMTVSLEFQFDGVEVTFGSDGTFKGTAGTQTMSRTVTMPASCLDGKECSSLEGFGVCTGEATCTCEFSDSDEKEAEEGTYAIDGNTFTITDEDGPGEPVSYCVKGDTLYAISEGPKGSDKAFVTYKRK